MYGGPARIYQRPRRLPPSSPRVNPKMKYAVRGNRRHVILRRVIISDNNYFETHTGHAMAKKTVIKNRPGRPLLYAGGGGLGAPLIGVRVPPLTLAAIDGWITRQKVELSRPEAIRRLVAMSLEREAEGW